MQRAQDLKKYFTNDQSTSLNLNIIFISLLKDAKLWSRDFSTIYLLMKLSLFNIMFNPILKLLFLEILNSVWAEIHQALLSQFSLLAELFNGKVLVKNRDSRVLKLVNLNPVFSL
jgi:hypothetical protein